MADIFCPLSDLLCCWVGGIDGISYKVLHKILVDVGPHLCAERVRQIAEHAASKAEGK